MTVENEIGENTLKRLASLKQKKYRQKYGLYLIEGEKTVLEAINAGAALHAVICAKECPAVEDLAKKAGAVFYRCGAQALRRLSDTKNPQPVIAYIKVSPPKINLSGSLYVVLDGLSDPYNVGSIIRTADAFGLDGVIVSSESCDIYNPKVQRAAMGSMFHVPVEQRSLAPALEELKRTKIALIATSPYGSETLPQINAPAALIIGSEARGISQQTKSAADFVFKINTGGRAESLNAAAAAAIAIYIVRERAGAQLTN